LATALPHFIYGVGEDALSLTTEYGSYNENATNTIIDFENKKSLCQFDGNNNNLQLFFFTN